MKHLPRGTKIFNVDGEFTVVPTEFIGENDSIGIAFVEDAGYPGGAIPTILGALLKESDNPNCMLITTSKYWQLWAIKDIYIHHPLTINTKLYL